MKGTKLDNIKTFITLEVNAKINGLKSKANR